PIVLMNFGHNALKQESPSFREGSSQPSGIAEPSQSDRRITQRLIDALALVDIRILDHFVVGDGEVISSAERGWI
ncbi:hypothetical protein EXA21_08115, partial [Vibrio cincinnatiensis]|uniref:JAB domain-containing protein n=1 Tax=Vibrio cincinnatiensis TaxID=675 RepID=UPI0023DEE6B3